MESLTLPPDVFALYLKYTLGALVIRLVANWRGGAYKALWNYASAVDVSRLLIAVSVASALCLLHGGLLVRFIPPGFGRRLPLAIIFMDCAFAVTAVVAPRLWRRLVNAGAASRAGGSGGTLIVGAGRLGQLLLQDLRTASTTIDVAGFVDDDASKHARSLGGVPVLGGVDSLPALIGEHKAELVIIAIRNPNGALVRRILAATSAAGVVAKLMPAPSEIAAGTKVMQALRTVDIDDLLRRPRVESDLAAVQALVGGKTVMVTGAGGSIGSELARQCARCEPAHLVLVDHNEDGMYQVQRRLLASYPSLHVVPIVADVRDAKLLRAQLAGLIPDVVYHAAAYKHVPLMEQNPVAALVNNVGGTLALLTLCESLGVPRVVIISSDKAVHPSSVMGATKRLTELLMWQRAGKSRTVYSAVRFGNVLGSRGSVVPLFLEQIQTQRRITVTHPEMTRFFMATSEAVELVLQASVLSRGGELFVLNMGNPIKIVDLARDLVRLSGMTPDDDVQIVFTGTRPGEKLHEALIAETEALEATAHSSINVVRLTDAALGDAAALAQLESLLSDGESDERLVKLLHRVIPELGPVPQSTAS
ncbi:MAG: nucleoside-diphosphate sugar epimerase/dehydratase [Gemmatimonadetes bacterium]|nr:nucleoside-diphosphate sugar epimerase/dehydratase [Gemmatimonadota bacterium]